MISEYWIITIISLSNIEQSFLCLLLFGEKKSSGKSLIILKGGMVEKFRAPPRILLGDALKRLLNSI
jgi:hypothetical protein